MAKPSDQMVGGTVGRGRLLASHADREQVIDTLKAAFVQGLLTKDEFDLRVGQTLGSRTYAELAVTADIPGGPIGAQLPPKRAQVQARAAGNTAVKSGVCTLTTIIVAFSTSAAAVSGPRAALIMALFLMGIGVTIAVIVALLTAGIRLLESRPRKRTSGQPSPRSSPGAGGQASRRPASGGPAGQFPKVDHGQQHTAEAVRNDLARPQSSGSRSPGQWRSRGLLAIGRAGLLRRAINAQLARVISGQSQLLRVSELGCSAASSANPQTIASLPPDSGQASTCTSSGSKPAGDRDVTRESGAVLQAGLQGVARCSKRCYHHLMNAQPEITQRDLRMRSKEIMDAVERGQAFTVTRDGRSIGELVPLRQRRRFVSRAEFAAMSRNAPVIDAEAFRADQDAAADQAGSAYDR